MNCQDSYEVEGCKVKINSELLTVTLREKAALKRKRDQLIRDVPYDIILQVGSEDYQVHAHKDVLIDDIDYFKAMFSENFVEASKHIIDLGSFVDFQAVSKLIDFLYKGSISVAASEVQALFQLSDIWGVCTIRKICCNFMAREIDASNCLDLLHLMNQHSCKELQEACQEVLIQQFQSVTYTQSFLELSTSQLVTVLDMENLRTGPRGEDFILEAIFRWYQHNQESRKETIAEVLDHVRIGNVSQTMKEKYLADPSLCEDQSFCTRLRQNIEFEERPCEQYCLVIGGCVQSRTGPVSPRTAAVEKYNTQTACFHPVAPLSSSPSYGVALNLMGQIVHVAIHVHCDQQTGKRHETASVMCYNTLTDQWKERNDIFSDDALDSIMQCLVRGGSVVYCGVRNVIYTVLVGGSMCIAVKCEDGEISCDVKYPLPSLHTHLANSHTGLKGISHRGKLYVMGGFSGPLMEREYSNRVLSLREDALEWEVKHNMLEPRTDFAVDSYGDEIFVTGGYGGIGSCRRLQRCERYNVNEDQWYPFAEMLRSRTHHSTVAVNDKLYTMGGKSYASQKLTGNFLWHPGGARIVSNVLEMVDPACTQMDKQVWTEAARMLKFRCNFSIVVV